MTNIVDYTRNNVMSAAKMLEVLSQRPHTVERMVVASSMSIYGEGAYRVPSTGAVVAPAAAISRAALGTAVGALRERRRARPGGDD